MLDAATVRKRKEFKTIRRDLIDRLERSGNDASYFLNLVEDYMTMYVTKELCKVDINERGVTVTSTGSTGQLITKKNDSVDQILKTNQQMIKLLDKLGISPDTGIGDLDEEM